MSSFSRRRFFMGAATAASTWSVAGANDRVNVGMVGLGGRGRALVGSYSDLPDCRIAAICDVNQAARERGSALVKSRQGHAPAQFIQMRELFASKDIDAVAIIVPNHWHALAMIWACQAGKDVYVEKPASHNPFESQQMIKAAAKYGRMVQVGMQSRTIAHKQQAIQLLREGVIGKLFMAKGLCYKRRKSIGRTPVTPVPAGIDWDAFVGPAPMRPFTMNRFAYNWHWFWDTGNGDIGNQGVHEMDIARWGLGKDTMPLSVHATGGKFAYDDDQETPNTLLAEYDYGDCMMVFEVRGLLTGEEGNLPIRGGNVIGNLFYGTDGYMALDVGGFQVYKGENRELVMSGKYSEPDEWDPRPHVAAFLRAVKSRDPKQLTAVIRDGALSADLCHWANVSYRVGRKLTWDSASGRFAGDDEAAGLLKRTYRNGYVVPAEV
ncbi:MAG TPA: Gfo/Idh/MocA family oxidoreductase [Bryobacteraceae bacterium]|nr:Gfo/Idh/MocA family oxidoreductase [Bryobacteraceae bacterium]